MITVRFHADARAELFDAARRYDDEDPGLGLAFAIEVERAVEAVKEAPERWPRWRPRSRERSVRVDRFPYVVVCEVSDVEIVVKAVAHVKRHPGDRHDRE